MNKRSKIVSVLWVLILFTTLSYTQEITPDFSYGKKWSAGLGFEYFKTTISWDEDSLISPLKSYLMTLHVGYEIVEGLNLGGIIGYASSDYESLTFRELPLSLTIDKGAIGGLLFGGEAEFTFYETDSLGFSIIGQYIYTIGGEKQWDIPGLAVEGTATGKPKWSRLTLGASFKYTATDPFVPYLNVAYSSLSGSFELEESIQSLNRREEKDISGVGNIMIGVGGIYDFSDAFRLHLEADFTPYGSGDNYDSGVDFGALVRIMYSF
ncbi:MAG: hypothetical protein PVH84_15815 [Candidatus Aminicenantes bacterium]|jgi:hypothetical protein